MLKVRRGSRVGKGRRKEEGKEGHQRAFEGPARVSVCSERVELSSMACAKTRIVQCPVGTIEGQWWT